MFDRGNSPWGISISPNGVLYAPNENSSSVAAMRIASNGALGHVSGSPFQIGQAADQFTDSEVSIDGRFLFVTAGLGDNRGVWSFGIRPDGGLSSLSAISRAPTPIPVGVRAAPNNRHLYVTNRNDAGFGEGPGGVSGFSIASNGSLSRIVGASPGAPFRTDGSTPFGLDVLRTAPPRRLYVGNGDSNNVGAFTADDLTGALSRVPGSPFPTAGPKPNHFAVASTITNAGVVLRSGSVLRYRASPGKPNKLGLGGPGGLKVFGDEPARSITPVPGSGCMPIQGSRVDCFRSGVSEVQVFLGDRDDSVNARNGEPERISPRDWTRPPS